MKREKFQQVIHLEEKITKQKEIINYFKWNNTFKINLGLQSQWDYQYDADYKLKKIIEEYEKNKLLELLQEIEEL